ncbi:MAG: hypothetical protein U0Y68_06215 [Blastocatellia bacterium]
MDKITSRAEFDQLARVYYQGRFYAAADVVIDRAEQGKIMLINSKRLRLQEFRQRELSHAGARAGILQA